MAETTTYSFLDISGNISHDSVGQASFNGAGSGSITITMAQDRTVHDVAADGSIMISKIAGDNGTIAIQVQQTSSLHKWLLKYWNYIKDRNTPANQYASASIYFRALKMGETITASGVAPQKKTDVPYQAQGQMVTWTLMAADIQHLPN